MQNRATELRNLTRRRLLQLSAASGLGISLPTLLRARSLSSAETTGKQRIKSCILVFYYGGPSQLDTYDMKPNAPVEVRGQFASQASSLPGLRISEHLPAMSKVMHKVTLVRTMHHQMRLHDAACVQVLTGRPPARGDGEFFAPPDQAVLYPSLGAALTYAWRERNLPVTNAALPYVINNVLPVPCQTGGFLGSRYNPFLITGDPATMTYQGDTLKLLEGLSDDRLRTRMDLVQQFEQFTGQFDKSAGDSLRAQYQKAVDLLSTQAVAKALDISAEPVAVRQRYGYNPKDPYQHGGTNGAELAGGRNLRGQNLLLARRLVEAGIPFVNVFDYRQQGQNWDSHSGVFEQSSKYLLPAADQALAALIEDLDERGLLDSTLVVALGEFGRTPQINKNAGRDHWPDCYCAILAGGGIKPGFVYGESDKFAAYPAKDPVSPADLAATIFSLFGLDPAMEMRDGLGRPFALSAGRTVHEMLA